MKTSDYNLRLASLFGCIVLCLITMLCAMPVFAQDKPEAKKVEKTYTLSQWAYTRLDKVYKAIEAKKYTEALAVLDEMKGRKRLPDHDRAMMWKMYGNIYALKTKYKKGVEAFQNCLKMEAMSKDVTVQMMYDLGQLLLATKQYPKAIEMLEKWLASVENPQPQAYHLIAMAYAQNKQYKEALKYMNIAIAKKKKVTEAWYQFQLSLNYQLEKFPEVAKILEILVTKFPKRTYWLQLAQIYSQNKKMKQALAVFELAYLQGYVNRESEYINLASLYMQQAIPIKAASIIEAGLKNGKIKKNAKSHRMLADALLYARETQRAIAPLKLAAGDAPKGDLYVQLAQIYIEKEKYAEAVTALNAAIKKGKLSSPGVAYLLLGMTKTSLRQYSGALTAFGKAAQHNRTKSSAAQWISIVKTKMREKRS